ncbi:MAG: hypothetical protein JJT89_12285 [Nitriliruptoraceae bacterium]|nr:hypothetical protein [Nitriliruptoraceae bacterium]
MLLPVLALLLLSLLQAAVVVRDVLVLHEAARAGARVAATTAGSEGVRAAAVAAAPELEITVHTHPPTRRAGQLVTVTVATERRIGPVTHQLRARAVAVVEPIVGAPAPAASGSSWVVGP